ncbi:MAG: diguanylate cyclase [Rhodocyclaceae bacterium]|nr:diguanylate cyclase [Rhodocyclaceae bacterium]
MAIKLFVGRIRYKIIAVVGIAVAAGLIATAAFYTTHQERSVLAQNERTMRKLTESVIEGLQSVMLAGSADIAQAFADRLKRVPEIEDFRVLRVNGLEAFRDNSTIEEVNERRGEEQFLPRDTVERIRVLDARDPNLQKALQSRTILTIYDEDQNGEPILTFLSPIANQKDCHKCHGSAKPIRGVLKLTTSLAQVQRDILRARQDSLLVLVVALTGTMLLTGFMLGRSVVGPIERVTQAMSRASTGDLDHQVPVGSRDELGRMAQSFNVMTAQLRDTYDGLRREQDKLTTIIRSAGEGIVLTDGNGGVVLVNPAAQRLLAKSRERIVADGLENLLDDPEAMRAWLADDHADGPVTVRYGDHSLQVFASTIHASDGHVVGSAALLRDVTEEKRLEEELRRLSTTDGLTGLFNRRHLDATLDSEWHRAMRTREPLSVLMFDVDHFKIFNDMHGHDQGDRVLCQVAAIFRDALRGHDVACRYGGEEFFAILPATPASGAMAVGERLRAAVAASEVDGLKVTISVGVASVPQLDANSPGHLVELVDAALYQAKRSGRDRVCMAGESYGETTTA